MGFAWVKAGPLVRSSYFAEEEQGEKGNGKRETQIHPVGFSPFPVSRFPFPGHKE
jgi:hypothetical protein